MKQQKYQRIVVRNYRIYIVEMLVVFTLGLLTGAVVDFLAKVIGLINRINF